MANIHTTSGWPFVTTLRQMDMVIFQEFDEREVVGRQIFNVKDSSQYQEDTITVGGVGIMPQKLEGQPLVYTQAREGFRKTYAHLDYGNGVRVTRNLLRDDMYGVIEDLAQELARSARATEETILANHFNNGFSSSFTGPDGKELFATDHVREDGSAYANELGTPADLAQTSLEQAMIDFSDFRDGGGKRIVLEPAVLLVPKELKFVGYRLTNSNLTLVADSDANQNAVNPMKGLLDVLVWNYLTDTDAWFLVAAKNEHKLMLYDREPFWTDYEYDFDTKDYKVSGMFAQSSGWSDPKGVFGTPGAA